MEWFLHFLMKCLFIALRVGIGAAVIKTGYDLASGNLLLNSSFSSDPITPVFIILLGCYIVFSSLLQAFSIDSSSSHEES